MGRGGRGVILILDSIQSICTLTLTLTPRLHDAPKTDGDLKATSRRLQDETAESGKTPSLSIPAQRHAASQQPSIHADLPATIPIAIPIPAQGSRSMEMSHLHCAAPRLPAPICTEGVPVACTHWCASLGWSRDGGVVGLSLHPITCSGSGDGGGGAIIMVSWARRS
ncbi:hypothetical protein V502_10190 [Pseudogymnoascus sp. VKM F-4520 (FW-2644)]|nr:hypothetical protein V502_10190 [Pseudogymnoascus sp. VKM F-4520 (FW-2644)]